MVVEADESDGTHLELPLYGTILTNVEADHLDYYGSLDEIVAGFIYEARERYNVVVFPSNIPFDYQGDYAHQDTATEVQ